MEKENGNEKAFASLRKKMQNAYQSIGLSPYSRLECGKDEFYLAKKTRAGSSYRFLQRLRRFSEALPIPERRVLLYSVLESSYHYEFWHMQYYSQREYRLICRELARKITEAFPI
ncbi:MAG: hypothetical protein J5736_05955 [Bacilli bacterium]|nr:hypothetical protein [Bacilli bacterium]